MCYLHSHNGVLYMEGVIQGVASGMIKDGHVDLRDLCRMTSVWKRARFVTY